MGISQRSIFAKNQLIDLIKQVLFSYIRICCGLCLDLSYFFLLVPLSGFSILPMALSLGVGSF